VGHGLRQSHVSRRSFHIDQPRLCFLERLHGIGIAFLEFGQEPGILDEGGKNGSNRSQEFQIILVIGAGNVAIEVDEAVDLIAIGERYAQSRTNLEAENTLLVFQRCVTQGVFQHERLAIAEQAVDDAAAQDARLKRGVGKQRFQRAIFLKQRNTTVILFEQPTEAWQDLLSEEREVLIFRQIGSQLKNKFELLLIETGFPGRIEAVQNDGLLRNIVLTGWHHEKPGVAELDRIPSLERCFPGNPAVIDVDPVGTFQILNPELSPDLEKERMPMGDGRVGKGQVSPCTTPQNRRGGDLVVLL